MRGKLKYLLYQTILWQLAFLALTYSVLIWGALVWERLDISPESTVMWKIYWGSLFACALWCASMLAYKLWKLECEMKRVLRRDSLKYRFLSEFLFRGYGIWGKLVEIGIWIFAALSVLSFMQGFRVAGFAAILLWVTCDIVKRILAVKLAAHSSLLPSPLSFPIILALLLILPLGSAGVLHILHWKGVFKEEKIPPEIRLMLPLSDDAEQNYPEWK